MEGISTEEDFGSFTSGARAIIDLKTRNKRIDGFRCVQSDDDNGKSRVERYDLNKTFSERETAMTEFSLRGKGNER